MVFSSSGLAVEAAVRLPRQYQGGCDAATLATAHKGRRECFLFWKILFFSLFFLDVVWKRRVEPAQAREKPITAITTANFGNDSDVDHRKGNTHNNDNKNYDRKNILTTMTTITAITITTITN